MSINHFFPTVFCVSVLIFVGCGSDENGAIDASEAEDAALEVNIETASESAIFFNLAVEDLPIMDATDTESMANFFQEVKAVATEEESDLIQAGFKYFINNRPQQIKDAAIADGAELPMDDVDALDALDAALLQAMYAELDGKNADELMLLFAACMNANGDLDLPE